MNRVLHYRQTAMCRHTVRMSTYRVIQGGGGLDATGHCEKNARTNKQTKQTDKQTKQTKQTDKQNKQTDKQTDKQNKQTDRQTKQKQTNKQNKTNRQTNKQESDYEQIPRQSCLDAKSGTF